MKKIILLACISSGLAFASQAQTRHWVGDKWGGGIVFYKTSLDHGLIAEIQDQGLATWGNTKALIMDSSNHSATGKEFHDWYLPGKDDLDRLYKFCGTSKVCGFTDKGYWSSSEDGNGDAWYQVFDKTGLQDYTFKTLKFYVRSIRSF